MTPAALYLRTDPPRTGGRPGVVAVLTRDAVRLPCALLLPATSAELPLTSLAPPASVAPLTSLGPRSIAPPTASPCLVGDGAVSWSGPRGPVVIRAVREWAPVRPPHGAVVAGALATVRAGLNGSGAEAEGGPLADAAAGGEHDAHVAVARLLGRGPGLTPSGDDLLAGFLVGAWVFGLDVREIVAATAVLAPVRTTTLSAALLWHAARGECIDQLAAVAAVLCQQPARGQAAGERCPAERAVRQLLDVGHTSGAALAAGLVLAAGVAA